MNILDFTEKLTKNYSSSQIPIGLYINCNETLSRESSNDSDICECNWCDEGNSCDTCDHPDTPIRP